ncbi:unnamed protein product [Kluyveromyces dobzhanskii CBS 2104]|uniref:WGS project CCBQ000000000 data, contig MAT n=1 Tax=Kluyveromyces dobzhanskii CBS 2104 TaxID=1427455 RepID=A0A0A8L3C2_9SACH|nr:unnamed protein product [Kluyveromyces dobzhanskii CBS 2104]
MALTGKRSHLVLLSERTDNDRNTVCNTNSGSKNVSSPQDAAFVLHPKRAKLNCDRYRVTAEISSPVNSEDDCNDTGYSSIDFDTVVHPSRKANLNFTDPSALAELVNCSRPCNNSFAANSISSAKGNGIAANDSTDFSNLNDENAGVNNNMSDSDMFSSTRCTKNYLTTSVPRPLSRHSSCVVPQSDLLARERCFDYIVQSIDEVWARYCDTTSSAENQLYPYGYVSPVSDSETSGNESDSGYKSSTDAETDCTFRKVSNLPDSKELQSLKDRLTKAKHSLEQTVDAIQVQSCIMFWNRWDMIKYNAVEMMEEEDDDVLVESVLEELEEGRWYNES